VSTPSLAYQHNNSGGAITVDRRSVGFYLVTVPDVWGPPGGGSVKVTAVGDTAVDCRLGWWGPGGRAATGEYLRLAQVYCFNNANQAVDQTFAIAYTDGINPLGNNWLSDAYVWATDSWRTDGYPPDPNYQLSRSYTQSGTVSIGPRYYEGPYDVLLERQHIGRSTNSGEIWDGGLVHITATSANRRCQPETWSDASWPDQYGRYTSGQSVRVWCFDLNGVEEDGSFVLQYTSQQH
jgi:hypothetical protein